MFGFQGRKDQGYLGNLRDRGHQLFYHYDATGNVTDLTDQIGSTVLKYRYDAFVGVFTQLWNPYNNTGLTGKSYDIKSSLMDYSARWYSPSTGRFTTEDTWLGVAEQPQTQNRYAYVINNPVNYTDPTGHAPCTDSDTGEVICSYDPPDDDFGRGGGWVPHFPVPTPNPQPDPVEIILTPEEILALAKLGFSDKTGLALAGKLIKLNALANPLAVVDDPVGSVELALDYLASKDLTLDQLDKEIRLFEEPALERAKCAEMPDQGWFDDNCRGLNAFQLMESRDFVGHRGIKGVNLRGIIPQIKLLAPGQGNQPVMAVAGGGKIDFDDFDFDSPSSSEPSEGKNIQLKYMPGWTAEQRAEADEKVAALTEAKTVKTKSKRDTSKSAASRYRDHNGKDAIPKGNDIDHVIDLQLGGADDILNMSPLNSSVNRSLGSQIYHRIKNDPVGTVYNRFTISD